MATLSPVLAADTWASNADLIVDVHRLYPLNTVRDVTYGRGLWWAKHRPTSLVGSDLRSDGVDFRDLPDESNSWPVVAFDPPYLPQGGRTTSTVGEMLDRYGLVEAAATWGDLRALIADGLRECSRICTPRGLVLVKCMNYVVGSKHRPQVAWAIADGEAIGLEVVAQFVHLKGLGPQPTLKSDGTPRSVRSPRANYSTLIVFRKVPA
jgi:hypothetical protein